MKTVDIIFVTNIPAFYKVNLYNRISKEKRILVIFTGDGAWERTKDFFSVKIEFDYISLQGNLFYKLCSGFYYILKSRYTELVVSGWDHIFNWICILLLPKHKNSCIVESTIFESKYLGIKGFLKRIFVKRISRSYVCGEPHADLLKKIKFKGIILKTGGCGILNYIDQPKYCPRYLVRQYLYVGRLVDVKNTKLLIELFNRHPDLELRIIGYGPLEKELKEIAKDNIIFEGPVDNNKLSLYYQQSDVFILPSYSEPWGLVVEESLNNGTPVIVSNHVGCYKDIVLPDKGIIFDIDNPNALENAINQVSQIDFYNKLRKNISMMDFQDRANKQVLLYTH